MNLPARIQLRRAKGWRLADVAPGAVVIRRPTIWRNPFVIGQHGNRAQCIARYAYMALGYIDLSTSHVDPTEQELLARHIRDHAADLRGKTLACTCRTCDRCHGDVLHILANRPEQAISILRWMFEGTSLRPSIFLHIDDLDRMSQSNAEGEA